MSELDTEVYERSNKQVFAMSRRILVIFAILATTALARESPHAKDLEAIVHEFELIAPHISDNVREDAYLDVPDLIRKYNYPLEVHSVTTPDGYILEMHRIPRGRDNNYNAGHRPTVFLMHGLLSSSADWVLMGPGCGLGYILAEEGYDVWMGNARGNYYSRRHTQYNPDSLLNTKFWEFSWDEIGNIDIPTMIDYALAATGNQNLQYIGHSQGTTAFFVMASLNPDYTSQKITSMHALAPVAYMANNQNLLLKMLAPFSTSIEVIAGFMGVGEFMPNNLIMTWAGQSVCQEKFFLSSMCSNILFLVGGHNPDQHNATMLPVKLGHTPAGSSVRQLAHYGQGISSKKFRRYDHGWISNKLKYGSYSPPNYDLSKITVPVYLHYSLSDPLAEVPDVEKLHAELGNSQGLLLVDDPKFSHLDFMWGIDAKTLIYERVIDSLKAIETPPHH